VNRYLRPITKITGGVLLVIFAVYASYLEIGLSLAFGYADWPKVYFGLAIFALISILGAWLVFKGFRQVFRFRHQISVSPVPTVK
jgi:hypothetical protein